VATAFSQILQFAAVKTDDELHEIERFEIRCGLLPHVVPSPGALLVTGITPETLLDRNLPSHYEAVREIRRKLIEWSPAVFIGYNSIGFDEELLRQALFQTLHPPYLTNTKGNERSDAMRIAHALHLYRPNTIAVPMNSEGRETFKLDRLAPINGFDHKDAHEAMADVEATIYVTNLAKNMAPDVWQAMRQFSNKTAVIEYVMREECFSLSERYFGRMYSWLVTYCGKNPEYDGQLAVFDLEYDPDDYISLSVEDLIKVLNKSPKTIRVLTANRQPIMMSADMAPDSVKAHLVSIEERNRRVRVIQSNREFLARVGEALARRFADRKKSPHVEGQIYDGFMSWDDQALLQEFHEADQGDRAHWLEKLVDPRLEELGQRLLFFENPDLLSSRKLAEMEEWLCTRILTDNSAVPWTTIPRALSEVDQLLLEEGRGKPGFLEEIRRFLEDRPRQLGLA
jgi:exodeoxyribonuclease-1